MDKKRPIKKCLEDVIGIMQQLQKYEKNMTVAVNRELTATSFSGRYPLMMMMIV